MSFCKQIRARFRVIALDKEKSKQYLSTLIPQLESGPRAEQQETFNKFVQQESLTREDVMDLLYDMQQQGWHNLQNPLKPSKAPETMLVKAPFEVDKVTHYLQSTKNFIDRVRVVDVSNLTKTDDLVYHVWVVDPSSDHLFSTFTEQYDDFLLAVSDYDTAHPGEREKIKLQEEEWIIAIAHKEGNPPSTAAAIDAIKAYFATL